MSPDTLTNLLGISLAINGLLLWFWLDQWRARRDEVGYHRRARIAAERKEAVAKEKADWIQTVSRQVAANEVENALARSRERAWRARDN